jgi:aminoglycoside phosphotransferase
MNLGVRYLEENRSRLGLERLGLSGRLTSLLITPRFRASAHVVALVFPDEGSVPAVAVKIARLRDSHTLSREAAILQHAGPLHRSPRSIPEVVAFEHCDGYPLLVQTALVGPPMDPASVRREPRRCVSAAVDWLCGFRAETSPAREPDWLERLIVRPLRRFGGWFGETSDHHQLAERAIAVVGDLDPGDIPRIVEHGDLSHPNLIWLPNGDLGVVDWELGQSDGVPGHDLFLFLAYVAAARARAGSPDSHAAAYRSAFAADGWALAAARDYARRVGVADDLLPVLAVLAWSRYVTGWSERLRVPASAEQPGETDVRAWIGSHRYAAIWREAITWAESRR